MKKPKSMLVKTGTRKDFLSNAKRLFKEADEGKPITEESYTLTFEEPSEMLHFLTESKIKLINVIRLHPESVSNLAKLTHRSRTAVSRDINEMERFGLIKTHMETNPGHGTHKIVNLIAAKLKLEATI